MRPAEAIPGFSRCIDFASVIAYAGATWDWHRIHYDPALIESSKLQGPLVDGQMFGALIAEQLMDWLGPRAFITNLSFRFRSMVFAGDTVAVEGNVDVVGDGYVTTLHRVVRGDDVAVEASAKVRLP